ELVYCFRDARCVVGILNLENIPADTILERFRHALFESIPLEPELAFVAAGLFGMVDAVEVEFPGVGAAKDGRLNWNLVANFPPKASGGFGIGDRSLAVLYEIRPLIVGHLEFR